MQSDSDAQRKAIEKYKVCHNRSSALESYNCTKKAKSGFYLSDFIKELFSGSSDISRDAAIMQCI